MIVSSITLPISFTAIPGLITFIALWKEEREEGKREGGRKGEKGGNKEEGRRCPFRGEVEKSDKGRRKERG